MMEDLIDLNSPSTFKFSNRNRLDLNIPKLVFNNPSKTNHTPESSFTKLETSFNLMNEMVPNFDIGRESIPFSPQLCGRESLQLLDPRVFQDIDNGRESLGILPNSIYSNSQEESAGPLNTAMLLPYTLLTRKGSALSSISSTHSEYNNIFNFSSLESTGPSRIFSLSSPFSENKSEFNIAYLSSQFKTKESVPSIGDVLNENINSTDFMNIDRLRLRSCPVQLNGDIKVEVERNCLSQTNRSKESVGSRTSSVEQEDDCFNDSVFIEAHHLASKIADGSILDGSFEEGNMLDCTPQPVWNDESDIEEKPNIPICDTETIFKKIDKMLPPVINIVNPVNTKQEHEEKNISSNSCNNSNDSNQPNLSAILNSGKKLNVSKVSSTNSNKSRSKDAKDIIQNLSEILNSGNISNEQKAAGQNLLINLADILYSDPKKEEGSDSGHSSIEAEEHNVKPQFYDEVLDLSKKGCSSFNKATNVEKHNIRPRLSHSFSFPSPKVPEQKLSNNLQMQAATMKNLINSLEGKCNVTVEANESKSSCSGVSSSFSKLKPKKVEDSANKRGPLKAVIPVNNMSRKDSNDSIKNKKSTRSETTPIRKIFSTSKLKRTSTPNAPKLKPVAQSTPEKITNRNAPSACSSQLRKKNLTCPLSPLTRPNSFDNMRMKNSGSADLNKSDSVPNISNTSSANESPLKAMNRRRSASDLKNQAGKLQQLRRTYSIGKENMLSFRKGSLGSSDKLKNCEKDESKLNNNSSRSNIKPFNLMAKMKGLKKGATASK